MSIAIEAEDLWTKRRLLLTRGLQSYILRYIPLY